MSDVTPVYTFDKKRITCVSSPAECLHHFLTELSFEILCTADDGKVYYVPTNNNIRRVRFSYIEYATKTDGITRSENRGNLYIDDGRSKANGGVRIIPFGREMD